MKRFFIILFLSFQFLLSAQDNIYKTLVPVQCDSLIKANKYNPRFVILDVRTPNEYIPQHLKGAINRNYYSANFDALLDSLDHNKTYLIHCKSGGRSGKAFTKMKNKNFKEVYNMKGGISAWNNASLPVTAEFAPRIMVVSDTIIAEKTVNIGNKDTISVTLTNRANDTLKFLEISSLDGTEFTTDFDISKQLQGAEDYTFNIFYQPVDEVFDSILFNIASNDRQVQILLRRNGKKTSSIDNNNKNFVKIYPNPASQFLNIQNDGNGTMKILIIDMQGKIIYSKQSNSTLEIININGYKPGMYFVKISAENIKVLKKIIISQLN